MNKTACFDRFSPHLLLARESMTRFIIIAILLAIQLPVNAAESITWRDLEPKKETVFDDPFESLSEGQLYDLSLLVRIRNLVASGKASEDDPTADEARQIVARLKEQGIDPDWLLSQRERVIEQRRQHAKSGGADLTGQRVRLPGYLLPLTYENGQTTAFLLVPWAGACSHTPPPPANQIVYAAVPEGIDPVDRFTPMCVEGELKQQSDIYDLHMLDGSWRIEALFTMSSVTLSPYDGDLGPMPGAETPAVDPNLSWFQQTQARVSATFTTAMMNIRDRQSNGPIWIGLLIAFAYGVVHTLGPGHGKAVVISYFVGESGTLWRGLRMGVQISVCHVLSAIVIVLITDFAVRQAAGQAPADYRLIKLLSYGMIATVGVAMLVGAVRRFRLSRSHEASHGSACSCCHNHNRHGVSGFLALAVGAVPCTGAILVLLFGLSHDLLWPAIMMVVAISAGMAVSMTAIGVFAIWGRNVADRRLAGSPTRQLQFAHAARVVGAALVLLIGVTLLGLNLTERNPF